MSECVCICGCASVCPCVGVHVCEWLCHGSHVKVRNELVTVDSILPPRESQGSDFNSQSQLKVLLLIELFHGPTGYIFKKHIFYIIEPVLRVGCMPSSRWPTKNKLSDIIGGSFLITSWLGFCFLSFFFKKKV